MQSYRRSGWEDQLAGEGAVLLVILVIIVAAVVLTAVIAMIKELFRIFSEHATGDTRAAQLLRYALVGFLAVCGIAGALMVLVPSVSAFGVYAAAWSFLLLVGIAEGVDLYARRHEVKERDRLSELDTYLDFTGGADSTTNPFGATPVPAEVA